MESADGGEVAGLRAVRELPAVQPLEVLLHVPGKDVVGLVHLRRREAVQVLAQVVGVGLERVRREPALGAQEVEEEVVQELERHAPRLAPAGALSSSLAHRTTSTPSTLAPSATSTPWSMPAPG